MITHVYDFLEKSTLKYKDKTLFYGGDKNNGRADNQIKFMGHRIELGEIESVVGGGEFSYK